VCTANEENDTATMPLYGIVLDHSNKNGSIVVGDEGANTQGNTFINPIIEGLKGVGAVGIHVRNAARNFFYGGSCESNTKQIQCEATSTNPPTPVGQATATQGNVFNGMYMEDSKATPGVQCVDRGNWNQWINLLAAGDNDNAKFVVDITAVHCTIIGGEIDNLEIEPGAQETLVSGTTVVTVSDGGTRTVYLGVYDDDAGVYSNTKIASRLDFNPDATHDVGASGAGRPRDIYVGRQLILQGVAPALRVNSSVANGTVATTLGSKGPAGSMPGAPQGWLPVSINGATRYIPFW
jgi:hypothetical protein